MHAKRPPDTAPHQLSKTFSIAGRHQCFLALSIFSSPMNIRGVVVAGYPFTIASSAWSRDDKFIVYHAKEGCNCDVHDRLPSTDD